MKIFSCLFRASNNLNDRKSVSETPSPTNVQFFRSCISLHLQGMLLKHADALVPDNG